MKTLGTEPPTFQFVVQCLNQLRHCVLHYEDKTELNLIVDYNMAIGSADKYSVAHVKDGHRHFSCP